MVWTLLWLWCASHTRPLSQPTTTFQVSWRALTTSNCPSTARRQSCEWNCGLRWRRVLAASICLNSLSLIHPMDMYIQFRSSLCFTMSIRIQNITLLFLFENDSWLINQRLLITRAHFDDRLHILGLHPPSCPSIIPVSNCFFGLLVCSC